MNDQWNRRRVLKQLAATSAAMALPRGTRAASALLMAPPVEREVQLVSVSEHTLRVTVLPVRDGQIASIPYDGSLVRKSWGDPIARLRGNAPAQKIKAGSLSVEITADPIALTIATAKGDMIQRFDVERDTG